MPNQLINETSPYLLQHAHNPVEWYPWGDEALQKAKNEDKPILVSIGYSACHWCHVMERESFENPQIAEIMNQYLVCIKVDREERPDVDAIYMDAIHAMGLRGGWPLNVFLMPDAKPFYGGTYFPPQKWANLVASIDHAFHKDRAKLQESAEGFTQNLSLKESEKYRLSFGSNQQNYSLDDLEKIYSKLSLDFDSEKGGMNRSPKFPMPSIWRFLLRYVAITKNEAALKQLYLTLDRIALGGIYDTIGGGWTRYSTDEEWMVPHFEKMLYDNGQLLSLYSEAFALTKEKLYQVKVEETIEWLEREMMSEEGGFFSAQDADSEGEEGKFYVWKINEINEILGEDAEEFLDIFGFSEHGNWEHGNNVVHLDKRVFWDGGFPIPEDIRQKLFNYRHERVKPGLDDKILCSWNALMLKGLIDAYRFIGNEKFLSVALKNANFILQKFSISVQTEEGENAKGLWHNYKNGNANIIAYLEDYAAVIEAFVALYQVTFDEKWLLEASMLMEYCVANFYDSEDEFFYFTDVQGEQLIARKKEIFDNVVPASNSILATALLNLGMLLDKKEWIELSDKMLGKLKHLVLEDPQWLTNWACLLTNHVKTTAEIAIIGENCQQIRAALDKHLLFSHIFAGTKSTSDLPLLKNRQTSEGETMIYVCYDKTCQLPTKDIEKALTLL